MIDQENLLVTTSRYLLLFDINSKQIVSSLKYCQDIPFRMKFTKFHGNIMISLKLKLNIIEIFEISQEGATDLPLFQFLGVLNFSNCVENLFEIDTLLAFRQAEDQVYELVLVAKMMESTECAVVTKMVFLVQFQLKGQNRGEKEREPEINYMTSVCDVDFSQEDIRVYHKNELWNYIFFDGIDTSAIQNDEDDVTQLQFGSLGSFEIEHYRVGNVHLGKGLIYIEQVGEKDKLLRVIQLRADEEGEGLEAEVKTSLSFDLPAKVYFDEVSNFTRIFVLEQNKDAMKSQLRILNEELDEVQKLLFPLLEDFISLKVIDADKVHVIGSEPGRAERLHQAAEEGSSVLSLFLNLEDLTFQRLVVEGEGPLLGCPHEFGGGLLISFTKGYMSFEVKNSDGIFFSKNCF